MQPFDYVKPDDLAEVIRLLAQANGRAQVLAGGTDLLIGLESGAFRPELLIDIKGLAALSEIRFSTGQGLHLGAAVTMAEMAAHADIRKHYPLLAQACESIGSPPIRNRATLGGNLCHASPGADTAPALMCYDAICTIAGATGQRIVPLSAFFAEEKRTVLAETEVLTGLTLSPPAVESAGVYHMFRQGRGGYITLVGVAVHVEQDEDASWNWRIALGAVAPTPIRVPEAEAILRGTRPKPPVIAQAAALARTAASPIDDLRASAGYCAALVEVLARRGIEESSAQLARGAA